MPRIDVSVTVPADECILILAVEALERTGNPYENMRKMRPESVLEDAVECGYRDVINHAVKRIHRYSEAGNDMEVLIGYAAEVYREAWHCSEPARNRFGREALGKIRKVHA